MSPDGSTVATTWALPERGGLRFGLAVIDVASGDLRVVLDDADSEYDSPSFSPDGQSVALVREKRSTPHDPGDRRVAVYSVADGTLRDLSGDWDHWPASALEWTPDGSALVLAADEDGRAPVFRVEVETGEFTRLTADDFAYSDVRVSPDGQHVYAMRTSYAEPLRPVRLDATTPDQESVALRGPGETPALPGTLTEVEATGEDGTRVRAWLALPDGASAGQPGAAAAVDPRRTARLVERVVVALEPVARRGPGVRRAAARPGAVHRLRPRLHPPGLGAVGRGAVHRPDGRHRRGRRARRHRRDPDRARWAARSAATWPTGSPGHTDRFKAIVTHASLWALDQFGPTTDAPWYWAREMTPEMAAANSPHLHVDAIRTPMLVIHGDKDYRVPIGEALRLWSELAERAEAEDGTMPHKFLYFPSENHWVLTPQHAKVWYQTVLAFVDHHVLGKDWQTPDLLQ